GRRGARLRRPPAWRPRRPSACRLAGRRGEAVCARVSSCLHGGVPCCPCRPPTDAKCRTPQCSQGSSTQAPATSPGVLLLSERGAEFSVDEVVEPVAHLVKELGVRRVVRRQQCPPKRGTRPCGLDVEADLVIRPRWPE